MSVIHCLCRRSARATLLYRNDLCVARMCKGPSVNYYACIMEYTIGETANGDVSEACMVLSCVLVWDPGTNVDSSHNELGIIESEEFAT